MKNFDELNTSPVHKFSADREHKPLELYRTYLRNSKKFYLKLGYFSTNAIFPIATSMASFLASGGEMNVIVNHILRKKDKDILVSEEIEDYSLIESALQEESKLADLIKTGSEHFFSCLKYLRKKGRLKIQPVKTKEGNMSHYKEGIFIDNGGNKVSFTGSCNFTYRGLVENGESITAFYSWVDENIAKTIDEDVEFLESIINRENSSYQYLDPNDIEEVIDNARDKNEQELIQDEKEIIANFKKYSSTDYFVNLVSEGDDLSETVSYNEDDVPKFPFDKPFEYQDQAYKNWVKNNYKGLFAMATGTGKTITALNCILEEYRKNGFYRFIVVVPTNPLAHQWQEESSVKFNYKNIVNSCIDRDWDKHLKRLLSSVKVGNNTNFGFITTYAQLQRSKLKSLFHQFENEFKEMTFIADEAHTLGSPGGLKNLPIFFKKRIGLSATPERKYDEYGSKKLEQFFDAHAPGYTFYYSMKEAIENKSLSEFEYHPIFVTLEYDEIEKYNDFTNRLRRYIDTKNGGYKDTKEAKQLLIQRKHVIHKAQNKLYAISDIINKVGKQDFKYAFVYVPEGYEPNYWKEEESRIDVEDTHIINHYSRLLDSKGLIVHNFLGGTRDRGRILNNFEDGKYDALLAMKCLDEGVDVPRTEYAIFCASTGNPRQFIQRRGRVLRTHDDKKFAKIYDLIVAPAFDELEIVDDAQVNVEKQIFQNELRRVINFLALATNRYELVEGEFGKKCQEFGIDNLKELILEELKSYETNTAYEDTE